MKKIIYVILIALLVGGAVMLVKKKNSQAQSLTPPPKEFVVISTYKPKMDAVKMYTEAVGEVKSDKEVEFVSKYPYLITFIRSLGEKVKKGELLIKLDDTEFLNNIEMTKKELESKQISLANLNTIHQRTKNLQAVGGVSQEQVDNEILQIKLLESSIDSIELKIKTLEENRKYLSLYAPYDGIIAQKNANLNELAMVGKPLFTFRSQSDKYIEIHLPHTQKALALEYKNKTYPLIDLQSSTNSMKNYIATIGEMEENIGTKVSAKIVSFNGKGTFLPNDCVLVKEDGYYIGIIENEKVNFLKINMEYYNAQGYVTKENLDEKSIIQAKPDAFLRAFFGATIKEAK